MLVIRKAASADIPAIRALLCEAALWQKDQGFLNKWKMETFTDEWFYDQFSSKTITIAEEHDIAVCAIMIGEVRTEVWPASSQSALYLSKFAVRRSIAGTGVGRTVFAWCERYAKTRGINRIRFDCPDAPRFVDYYTSMGYVLRGGGVMRTYRYVLMEKMLEA